MPFDLYKELVMFRDLATLIAREVEGAGLRNWRDFRDSKLRQFSPVLYKLVGGSPYESLMRKNYSLMNVGLGIYDEPEDAAEAGYDWLTPRNCRVFGRTGIAGTHFSFIPIKDQIDENSPVVASLPGTSGNNCIVGENLRDFLCLGCYLGYAEIQNIDHSPSRDRFGEKLHLSIGQRLFESESDQRSRKVLAALRYKFRLSPWADVHKHYATLQEKYLPYLQPPISEENK